MQSGFLVAALSLALALSGCTAAEVPLPLRRDVGIPLTRIAFGSCARQTLPQPIWDSILAVRPGLFIHLGDNIYADTENMAVMRARYAALGAKPAYRRLRRAVPVVATWDDHDYGRNDAGAEYPMKRQSKRLFLDFFGEPQNSARRRRNGGIYTAYLYGPPGQRVQVILLDLRYDRSPLLRVPREERPARRARNMGYYRPNPDPTARMMSEDQWAWLERQLRVPAELRLIASSVQVLSDFTGRESWANLPRERERLIRLIARTGARGVVFLSGDVHLAEIARRTERTPYPLWEVTSSALNQRGRRAGPNRNRVLGPYGEPNFGLIEIDWSRPDPEIRLAIHNLRGEEVLHTTIALSALSP